MIKHIVLWKLKDRSRAREMKAALDALPAMIPQIRAFEVGIGEESGEAQADIALLSAFDSMDHLHIYASHPEHQKVVALVRELASERRVIDYIA